MPFAVLGHPIGHTLSPVMHNASIEAIGMDAIYLAFDVEPRRLIEVLQIMQVMGFGGINLTIPHKEIAFRELDHLDDSARMLGAVNTVQFDGDTMVGHNTDGYGFLKAMDEAFGEPVEGASMFVLGCGGAGRAVALTAAREGVSRVVLADVDESRCRHAADDIAKASGDVVVDIVTNPRRQTEACRGCDIVVQATPVGMKQDDAPLLNADAFTKDQRAFDLIYMYPETVFMREAALGGARTANGLGMLLHQGARSFEIWTGREPSVDAMRAALEAAVYGGA